MNDILRMIGVASLLIQASGCAALTWFQHETANLVLADAQHPVERIVCIWQPAEGHGLDGLPCRGFAGQIFFFTRGLPTPVVANGEVEIFVFDDQGTPEEQTKPLHEFEFTPEAWTHLLHETQLGPAYSLFVPYPRKGRHEAHCALLVRLKPANGPMVASDMAYVTLPGVKKQVELTDQKSGGKAAGDTEAARQTATRTTTIRPSPSLAAKLAQAAAKRPDRPPKMLSAAVPAKPISSTDEGKSQNRSTSPAGTGPRLAPSGHSGQTPRHAPEVEGPSAAKYFRLTPARAD